MILPLRDTIPSRRAPVVTVALIAVNVLVFLHEAALGPYLERFVFAYGLVPRRLVFWRGDPLDPVRFLPLLTSMFWHGGWLHLLGNMLYLWIFGDNVEDRLGHRRFLAFYLACGVAAALTQVVLDPTSPVPTVGASGAIAGVLGAYLLLYPGARVVTLVFIVLLDVPAVLVLAAWFLTQLVSALASLHGAGSGGVAWWAHVGGFVAGFVLVKVLEPHRRRAVPAAW